MAEGSGGSARFTVEFLALTKDLEKAFTRLKKLQGDLDKGSKKSGAETTKSSKSQLKGAQDYSKVLSTVINQENQLTRLRLNSLNQQTQAQRKLNTAVYGTPTPPRQRPGGGGARPGAPGAQQQQGGGGFGLGVLTGVAGTLALSAFNFGVNAITSAYQQYVQYGATRGRLSGLSAPGQIKGGLGAAFKGPGGGAALGFTKQELAEQFPLFARATGQTNQREMLQAMRATGMGAGEVSGVFGGFRQAGLDFGGARQGASSEGGRQFQKLMEGGLRSGLEKSRLRDYFEGVDTLLKQQMSISAGKVDIQGLNLVLSQMGSQGGVGFQGPRGSAIGGAIQRALVSPGGGKAGEAFMLQAMGFGVPGGATSYVDALRMRERGISDPQNFNRIMQMSRRLGGGGGDAVSLMLRNLIPGISVSQADVLQKIKIGPSGYISPEDKKRMDEISKSTEPLEKQAADAFKGMGDVLGQLAKQNATAIDNGQKVTKIFHDWEDLTMELTRVFADLAKAIYEWIGKKPGIGVDVAGAIKKDEFKIPLDVGEMSFEKRTALFSKATFSTDQAIRELQEKAAAADIKRSSYGRAPSGRAFIDKNAIATEIAALMKRREELQKELLPETMQGQEAGSGGAAGGTTPGVEGGLYKANSAPGGKIILTPARSAPKKQGRIKAPQSKLDPGGDPSNY